MIKALKTLVHVFGILLVTTVFAQPFVVKKIKVNGLTHLSTSTVLSYVPLKTGQTFTQAKGRQIIARLYQTKFFNNI
jgi:outer membrane protein insertion porin family